MQVVNIRNNSVLFDIDGDKKQETDHQQNDQDDKEGTVQVLQIIHNYANSL